MLHRVLNPVRSLVSGFAGGTQSAKSCAASLTVWLLAAAVLAPASPAMAQNNAPAPAAADQQAAPKVDAKVELRLDAQRRVNGPAGNPECYELGTNALNRLVGDDIDTAFRHLDLYDR